MSYPKTVIYKDHKVLDLYCTVCQRFLLGNASTISPHRCLCGVYIYNQVTGEYEVNTLDGVGGKQP